MTKLVSLVGALAAALIAGPAAAQTKFPTDSIRILVPYGPGGATDTSFLGEGGEWHLFMTAHYTRRP